MWTLRRQGLSHNQAICGLCPQALAGEGNLFSGQEQKRFFLMQRKSCLVPNHNTLAHTEYGA